MDMMMIIQHIDYNVFVVRYEWYNHMTISNLNITLRIWWWSSALDCIEQWQCFEWNDHKCYLLTHEQTTSKPPFYMMMIISTWLHWTMAMLGFVLITFCSIRGSAGRPSIWLIYHENVFIIIYAYKHFMTPVSSNLDKFSPICQRIGLGF